MTPIQAILKKILEEQIDNEEFLFAYLKLIWKKMVGEEISKITEIISYKKNILKIKIYDENWLTALEQIETEIKEKINREIGKEAIKKIEFKKGSKNTKGNLLMNEKEDRNEGICDFDELKESELIEDPQIKSSFKRVYYNLQRSKSKKIKRGD